MQIVNMNYFNAKYNMIKAQTKEDYGQVHFYTNTLTGLFSNWFYFSTKWTISSSCTNKAKQSLVQCVYNV